MRRIAPIATAPVMITLFVGYGLAADRVWTAVPEGDLQDLPTIRDIATSANDVFAVGNMGLFYHYDSGAGSLTRIHSPTTATLRYVWARSAKEVYALGDGGTILYFDGSTLKRLGARLPMVIRKDHPELDSRPCEVHVQSIWASSPRDVWVTGLPMVLLHFDGERWTDVDIGAKQVIVPSDTRLTRGVVSPRIGPVWGTRAGDVWVRKEVVEAVAKPDTGPLRPRRAYFRSAHVLMRFDGSKWRETDKKMHVASGESLDSRLTLPEVQIIPPKVIWARFDNALHRWDNSDWQLVAELPKSKKSWTFWTGSQTDAALIFSLGDGIRELTKGSWRTVSPLPDDLVGNGPLGMTDDGAIVLRGPHYKRLVFGR